MRKSFLLLAFLATSVLAGPAPAKKSATSTKKPAGAATTTPGEVVAPDSSRMGGLAISAPARKLVAVVPLASGNIPREQADLIGEALSTALQQRGGVRMMERSQMEKILQEQGFQNSGACDKNECAVQMGKLLGIDQIVVGSVGKLGNSYMLNARRVDVATGEILGSTSRTVAGRIEQVASELPPAAADLYAPAGSTPAPAMALPASPTTARAPSDSETYEVEILQDEPESARALFSVSTGLGSYANIAPFTADWEVSTDVKIVKGLHLEASFLQDYWNWIDIRETEYSRNANLRMLPVAAPESGDPSTREISLGLTWMFHREERKETQAKVIRTDLLFSSLNLRAYRVNTVDVPLVVQSGTGLRAGLTLDRHPVLSENGNGKSLVSKDPSNLVLSNAGYVYSTDSTSGWTYQRNSIAYLGLSRETRQGSLIEVTRRETGEKIQIRSFIHSAWFADVMLALQSEADPVQYDGTTYKLSQGDNDGQVPSRIWGFRVGFLLNPTKGMGFQTRTELGMWPGSGSFYVRTSLGLDLGI